MIFCQYPAPTPSPRPLNATPPEPPNAPAPAFVFGYCEECSRRIPDRRSPAPESVLSLPSHDRLRFFEAPARHRSFVPAGQEPGVTAPAVGHRIRTLDNRRMPARPGWMGGRPALQERGIATGTPAGSGGRPPGARAWRRLPGPGAMAAAGRRNGGAGRAIGPEPQGPHRRRRAGPAPGWWTTAREAR